MTAHDARADIEVFVEHLLLDSVAPLNSHVLRDTLQKELTRLLEQPRAGPIWRRDVTLEALPASELRLGAGATDEVHTATRLARTIHSALGRSP